MLGLQRISLVLTVLLLAATRAPAALTVPPPIVLSKDEIGTNGAINMPFVVEGVELVNAGRRLGSNASFVDTEILAGSGAAKWSTPKSVGHQLRRRLEAPSWTSPTVTAEVADMANVGTLVAMAGATDPDPAFHPSGQLTYSMNTDATSTSAAALVAVNANTGAVTTLQSLAGLTGTSFTVFVDVVDGLGETPSAGSLALTVIVRPSYCQYSPMARFVRVSKPTGYTYSQIGEIEVYGVDGFAGANIALNKPAVAGTVYTSCSGQGAPSGYCEPYFVNDGSLSTFAMTAANTQPDYVEIDLTKETPVKAVRVRMPVSSASGYVATYQQGLVVTVYSTSRAVLYTSPIGYTGQSAYSQDFTLADVPCQLTMDSAPTFGADAVRTVSVIDGATVGSVVATITATDADPTTMPAGAVTLDLVSVTPNRTVFFQLFNFSKGIVTAVGNLSAVRDNPALNTYVLTVAASDALGATAAVNATVTLAIRAGYTYTTYACAPGWNAVVGSDYCYQAYTALQDTWPAMRDARCPSLSPDASLASVRNNAEWKYVLDSRCGGGTLSTTPFWVGLNDINQPCYLSQTTTDGKRSCCWSWANGADPTWVRTTGKSLVWYGTYPSIGSSSTPGYNCMLNNYFYVANSGNPNGGDASCASTFAYGCCERPKTVPLTTVTRVNEPPFFATAGTTVSLYDSAALSTVVATVTASDNDPAAVDAGKLVYSVQSTIGAFSSYFALDPSTGAVSVTAALTGLTGRVSGSSSSGTGNVSVVVSVRDLMGGVSATTFTVTIVVLPGFSVVTSGNCIDGSAKVNGRCFYVNSAPQLLMASGGSLPTILVPYNTPVGTSIPGVGARDPDVATNATGDPVNTSILNYGGSASAYFTLSTATGALTVSSAIPSGMVDSTFYFTVGVRDDFGANGLNATLPIVIGSLGYKAPGVTACPFGYTPSKYGSRRCYKRVTLGSSSDYLTSQPTCAADVPGGNASLAIVSSWADADSASSVCSTESWFDVGAAGGARILDYRAIYGPAPALAATIGTVPAFTYWFHFMHGSMSSKASGATAYESQGGITGTLYNWQIGEVNVPGGYTYVGLTGAASSYIYIPYVLSIQSFEMWVRFPKETDQPNAGGAYQLLDCRYSNSGSYISGGTQFSTGPISGGSTSTTVAPIPVLPYNLIGDLYWPMNPGNVTPSGTSRLALDVGTAGLNLHVDLPLTVLLGSEGASSTMYLDAASWPYPAVLNTADGTVPSGYMQSVSLWYWKTANNPDGGYQALFQRGTSGGNVGFSIWVSGTSILAQNHGTGGVTVSFNSFTLNTWNHVVLVFRGDQGMSMFSNNAQSTYSPGNLINPNSTAFIQSKITLGAAETQGNRFQGYIADVRFYGRMLTPRDVTTLFSGPSPKTVTSTSAGVSPPTAAQLPGFGSTWQTATTGVYMDGVPMPSTQSFQSFVFGQGNDLAWHHLIVTFSSSQQCVPYFGSNYPSSNTGNARMDVADIKLWTSTQLTAAQALERYKQFAPIFRPTTITRAAVAQSISPSAPLYVPSDGLSVTWAQRGWLPGYTYRLSHTIGAAFGANAGYVVRFVVKAETGVSNADTAFLGSKVQRNFEDVRVTASDGFSQLPLWRETYEDGRYAIFWTRIPVSLASAPYTVFIYYGVGDAAAATLNSGQTSFDGTKVFDFFDDFAKDGGTKWGDRNLGAFASATPYLANDTLGNGILRTRGGSATYAGGAGSNAARTGSTYNTFLNGAIEFAWRWPDTSGSVVADVVFRGGGASATTSGYKVSFSPQTSQSSVALHAWGVPYSGTSVYTSSSSSRRTTPGVWNRGRIAVSQVSTTMSLNVFVLDDGTTVSTADAPYVSALSTSYVFGTVQAGEIGLLSRVDTVAYTEWDWVGTRQYVSPEPAHGAWGAEETSATSAAVVSSNAAFLATTTAISTGTLREAIISASVFRNDATLLIWLDAASLSAYSDGYKPQFWANRGSFGIPFRQATASYRPTVRMNALNSLPVLRFTRSASTSIGISGVTFTAPYTIMYVARMLGTANYAMVTDGGGTTPGYYYGYWAGNKRVMFAGHSIVDDQSASTPVGSDATWHIVTVSVGFNYAEIYEDGVLVSSGPSTLSAGGGKQWQSQVATSSTYSFSAPAYLSIGGNAVSGIGTYNSDAEFAELLVFGKTLGSDERNFYEAYLRSKFALTPSVTSPAGAAVTGELFPQYDFPICGSVGANSVFSESVMFDLCTRKKPSACCSVDVEAYVRNSAPAFPVPSYDVVVPANAAASSIIATITAIDVDPSYVPAGTLTYTMASGNTTLFAVTSVRNAAVVTLKTTVTDLWRSPSTNSYTITITVVDGMGVAAATSATLNVVIRASYQSCNYQVRYLTVTAPVLGIGEVYAYDSLGIDRAFNATTTFGRQASNSIIGPAYYAADRDVTTTAFGDDYARIDLGAYYALSRVRVLTSSAVNMLPTSALKVNVQARMLSAQYSVDTALSTFGSAGWSLNSGTVTYRTSTGYAGAPSVDIAASSRMIYSGAATPLNLNTGGMTLVVQANGGTSYDSNEHVFELYNPLTGNRLHFGRSGTTTGYSLYFDWWTTFGPYTPANPSGWFTMVWRFEPNPTGGSSTISVWVDGVFLGATLNAAARIANGDFSISSSSPSYLGYSTTYASYFTGSIGTFALYDRPLTDAEVDDVHKLLLSQSCCGDILTSATFTAGVQPTGGVSQAMGGKYNVTGKAYDINPTPDQSCRSLVNTPPVLAHARTVNVDVSELASAGTIVTRINVTDADAYLPTPAALVTFTVTSVSPASAAAWFGVNPYTGAVNVTTSATLFGKWSSVTESKITLTIAFADAFEAGTGSPITLVISVKASVVYTPRCPAGFRSAPGSTRCFAGVQTRELTDKSAVYSVSTNRAYCASLGAGCDLASFTSSQDFDGLRLAWYGGGFYMIGLASAATASTSSGWSFNNGASPSYLFSSPSLWLDGSTSANAQAIAYADSSALTALSKTSPALKLRSTTTLGTTVAPPLCEWPNPSRTLANTDPVWPAAAISASAAGGLTVMLPADLPVGARYSAILPINRDPTDSQGGNLTFTILSGANSYFIVHPNTGAFVVRQSLSGLPAGTQWPIVLQATDGFNAATSQLNVTVVLSSSSSYYAPGLDACPYGFQTPSGAGQRCYAQASVGADTVPDTLHSWIVSIAAVADATCNVYALSSSTYYQAYAAPPSKHSTGNYATYGSWTMVAALDGSPEKVSFLNRALTTRYLSMPDTTPGYRKLTAFVPSTNNEYKFRASWKMVNASVTASGVTYVGTQLITTGAECPSCAMFYDPVTNELGVKPLADAATDPYSVFSITTSLDGAGDRGPFFYPVPRAAMNATQADATCRLTAARLDVGNDIVGLARWSNADELTQVMSQCGGAQSWTGLRVKAAYNPASNPALSPDTSSAVWWGNRPGDATAQLAPAGASALKILMASNAPGFRDMSATLLAWLDAAALTTYAQGLNYVSGSAISSWPLKGTGVSTARAAFGTYSSQMLYKPNGLNGYGVAYNPGTGYYVAGLSSVQLSLTTGFTAIVVARHTGTRFSGPMVSAGGSYSNWYWGGYSTLMSVPRPYSYIGGYASSKANILPNDTPQRPADTNWHIHTLTLNSAYWASAHLDGSVLVEGPPSNDYNQFIAPTNMYLGGSGYDYVGAEFAELLVFEKPLSGMERLSVENYLATKYNILGGVVPPAYGCVETAANQPNTVYVEDCDARTASACCSATLAGYVTNSPPNIAATSLAMSITVPDVTPAFNVIGQLTGSDMDPVGTPGGTLQFVAVGGAMNLFNVSDSGAIIVKADLTTVLSWPAINTTVTLTVGLRDLAGAWAPLNATITFTIARGYAILSRTCPAGWFNPVGSGECFRPTTSYYSGSANARTSCRNAYGTTLNGKDVYAASIHTTEEAAYVVSNRCGGSSGYTFWTGLRESGATNINSKGSGSWYWEDSTDPWWINSGLADPFWANGYPGTLAGQGNSLYDQAYVDTSTTKLMEALASTSAYFCCRVQGTIDKYTYAVDVPPTLTAPSATYSVLETGAGAPLLVAGTVDGQGVISWTPLPALTVSDPDPSSTAGGSMVWTIVASNGGTFTADAGGRITAQGGLLRRNGASITLTVRVRDMVGLNATDSATIKINIVASYFSPTDNKWHVNTAPFLNAPVASSKVTLSENAVAASRLGQVVPVTGRDSDYKSSPSGTIAALRITLTSYYTATGATNVANPISGYTAATGLPVPTVNASLLTQSDGSARFDMFLLSGAVNFEQVSKFGASFVLVDGDDAFTTYTNSPIFVGDVNEGPSVSKALFSGGNWSIDTAIGVSAPIGYALEQECSDPDFGQSFLFEVLDVTGYDAAGANTTMDTRTIRVGACTGQLQAGQMLVDLFDQPSPPPPKFIIVHLRIGDTGVPQMTTETWVNITVFEGNKPPYPTNSTHMLTVPENSPAGTALVMPPYPLATDPNTAAAPPSYSNISYSIYANDRNMFRVRDPVTGALELARGGMDVINFEVTDSAHFSIVMRVADQAGLEAFFFVNVDASDAPESPHITNAASPRTISENTLLPPFILSAGDMIQGPAFAASDPDAADSGGSACVWSFYTPNMTAAAINYFQIDRITGVVSLTAAGATYGALDYESATKSYTLWVRATDTTGLNDTVAAFLAVADVNEAPVLAANLTINMTENSNGPARPALNASDPEQDTVKWTLGGPDSVWFTISDLNGEVSPAAGKTIDYESRQSFSITVTATDFGKPDGRVLSSSAPVTVNVIDVNERPLLASAAFVVMENTAAGNSIANANASLTASDPDTLNSAFQIAGYTLVSSDKTPGGQVPFSVAFADGSFSVASGAVIDFEAKRSYTVVVAVTDRGGLNATTAFTVNVANVNEAPTWTSSPSFFALALESQSVGTPLGGFVSDPDMAFAATGEKLNFTILSGNTGNTFAIASNGQLYVANNASLTHPQVYSLSVRVTDAGIDGAQLSATITVTVTTVDNNHPPVWSGPVTLYIDENSAAGAETNVRLLASDPEFSTQSVTYTLEADGANANRPWPFSVITLANSGNNNVGAGRVVVVSDGVSLMPWSNLDFEAPAKAAAAGSSAPVFNTYTAVATATDSHSSHLSSSVSVTIIVRDVPEAPYFSLWRIPGNGTFGLTVPENSATSTQAHVVEEQSSLHASPEGGILALDDDAADVAGNLTYSWKVSGVTPAQAANANLFTIHPTTGVVTVSSAGAAAGALNFEASQKLSLVVQVTDTTGRTDIATVTVNLADVNEAPTLVGSGMATLSGVPAAALSVPENATASTAIGKVNVADVDIGDAGRLVYSMGPGIDSLQFTVNDTTGVVYVAEGAALDWEDKPVRLPTVIVTDSSSSPLSITVNLTVNVMDVSDILIDAIAVHTADVNANKGFNVGTTGPYSATHGSMSALVVTDGGARVVLTGRNFGFSAARLAAESLSSSPTTVTATYGMYGGGEYTATGCSITVAGTEITCTTAEGFGVNHVWRVRLTTTASGAAPAVVTSTIKTGYLPPAVTSVALQGASISVASENAMTTEGNATLIVRGSNLGPAVASWTVMYGPVTGAEYTAVGCRAVTAHSAVSCRSVPGVGAGLKFTIQVGPTIVPLQVSPTFEGSLVAYLPPVITNITAPLLETSGGGTVKIDGANFGTSDTIGITAQYGSDADWSAGNPYTATNCLVSPTAPHHTLLCDAVAGVGHGHRWVVKVGGQASAGLSTPTTSYKAPTVTAVAGPGVDRSPTTGQTTLYIQGTSFGPATASGGVALASAVAPLVRYGHFNPANATFEALRFEALACSVTVAHTQITCVTAPGTGKDLRFSVSVGGQASAISASNVVMSYAPPSVAQYRGPGSTLANTTGGQDVIITGFNFGPADSPIDVVTFGPDGHEFTAAACMHTVPHTEITCLTSVGAGRDLTWVVTIDGQASTAPVTDYHIPVITGLSGPGAADASTDGGDDIIIQGQYFSLGAYLERVTYGQSGLEYTAANCSVTVPHTEITCKTLPGTGRKLRWIVTVRRQASLPSTVTSSYAHPVISMMAPASGGSTAGGITLQLRGSDFGLAVRLATVKIYFDALHTSPIPSSTELSSVWASVYDGGSFNAAVNTWMASLLTPRDTARTISSRSNHTLMFTLPEGFGRGCSVFVVVDGVPSNIVTWDYADPIITNVAPDRQGMDPGFLRVWIEGSSFCKPTAAAPNCGVVQIDGSPVASSSYDHSRIMVVVSDPTLTNSFLGAQVVVNGIASNLVNFSAPVPSFDAISGQGSWAGASTTVVDRAVVTFDLVVSGPVSDTTVLDPTVAHQLRAAVATRASINTSYVAITSVVDADTGVKTTVSSTAAANTARLLSASGVNITFSINLAVLQAARSGAMTPDALRALGTAIVAALQAPGLTSSLLQALANATAIPIGSLLASVEPVASIVDTSTVSAGGTMSTAGGQPFYIGGIMSLATVAVTDISILIGGRACSNVTKTIDGDLAAQYGIDPASPLAEQYRTYRVDALTPPGAGRDLPIVIVVPGGQSRADSSFVFSYAPPSIADVVDVLDTSKSYLSASNGIATVGADVILRGSNFGALGVPGVTAIVRVTTATLYPPFARRVHDVPVSSWTHTSLRFRMPAGQGSAVDITLLVSGQTSIDAIGSGPLRAPVLVRYAAPKVFSVMPQRSGTRGGVVVTINGSNFGTAGATDSAEEGRPSIIIGGHACALVPGYTSSVAHDAIQCIVPEGQGANQSVVVTVAGQSSVGGGAYSYAPPRAYSLLPPSGPTSGKRLDGSVIAMTLIGDELGISGSVEFRPLDVGLSVVTVPNSAVYTHNHTVMTFPMPEGAGRQLLVTPVIGGQVTADTLLFAYDPPSILAMTRADKTVLMCAPGTREVPVRGIGGNISYVSRWVPAGCYPTRGGFNLRITGESFGMGLPRVTLGGRVCEVLSHDHNEIIIRVPGGYGDSNPVVVSAGASMSAASPAAVFVYDPPTVTAVVPNQPQVDLSTSGEYTTSPIEIRGENFGAEETPLSIIIGGLDCLNQQWQNDNLLRCTPRPDTVGPKNVSILVANRTQPFVWLEGESLVELLCKKGLYGMRGEYCVNCATEQRGASCPGGEVDVDLVTSLRGWWRTDVDTPSSLCHPLRQGRAKCPVFQPCEPAESCLGANMCAEGYTDDRCANCVSGKYYRVNGECIKCPDSPFAVVIIFVVGAMLALLIAYFLSRKNINLALISIGIDYFQVVAMFARTRIRWPALVKQLFLVLSAFNLNLELIAPECAIPEVTYAGKWLFIEGLPIFGWALLTVGGALRLVYKRLCTTKRGTKLFSHFPILASTSIVVLRVLYIYITRTTFDVFNCAPTSPPDGNEYMAWQLSIICYQPGGTHLFLLPFAVAGLVVYVIGAPLTALWFMRKNRLTIKYDQILRAQGLGARGRLGNRASRFRKAWHKLYYHFLPGKWYWEGVVTARKFLIAFTSLMFRQTPSYQLALSLLVLFAAYVLHVRHSPYMTHENSKRVVHDHLAKVAEGDPVHTRIHRDMVEDAALGAKKGVANRIAMGSSHVPPEDLQTLLQNMATKFRFMRVFDYNTAEAVMLASAVLVNLAGIMFDSARFQGDNAIFYAAEYDSLAYSVIVLIFFSLIYWAVCLAMDLSVVCCHTCATFALAKLSKAGNSVSHLAVSAGRRPRLPKGGITLPAGSASVGAAAAGDSASHATVMMQYNPMMEGGADKAAVKDAGSVSIEQIAKMDLPPDAMTWASVRALMLTLHKRNVDQAKEREGLGEDFGAGSPSTPRIVSSVAMRTRVEFGPMNISAGGSASNRTPRLGPEADPGTPQLKSLASFRSASTTARALERQQR